MKRKKKNLMLNMEKTHSIALDYSHNNMVTLEASSYSDFTQFLFASGYKLGKIEGGFSSALNLKDYDAIIVSTPKNINLTSSEIENLEQYVRNGGGLLLVSTRGGDYMNRTNLNDLTKKFGFRFVADEVSDSVNYVGLQKRQILDKFKSHYITEEIQKIILSSACSIETFDLGENRKNVRTDVVVEGGLYCFHNVFDGQKWTEEDSPKIPLMVCVEYFKGKVFAFGSLSIFSSLGREYGFVAFDNDLLIANILRWLIFDTATEGKVITVDLQQDLYLWAKSVLKKDGWANFSSLINRSLRVLRENYANIIKEMKESQLKNVEKKTEIIDGKAVEDAPEFFPKRKKEDLKDIISAIEEISGEKYESSIDLEDIPSEDPKDKEKIIPQEVTQQLPEDLSSLTVKELKQFCKKQDIHLPKNARKNDIIKVIKFVIGTE
ncbi:MAG: Gldg family protein [Promethearchaeota archaeon]